jgi:pimeloyl-ACP methyl ester carboxylesterase
MIPLVLLPGMMCDARLWHPLYTALSAHHSLMHMPLDRGDTPEVMATDVLTAAPQRFAVLGLSMGGPIAMEIIRQAPERVEKLALLSTNHRAERADISAGRVAQIARAKVDLATVMSDELIPHYVPDGPDAPSIRSLCLEMALAVGSASFAAQSTMLMQRKDQAETLRNFAKPSLILCGGMDKLCPPDWHRDMEQLLQDARLVIIESAGHLPVLEKPQQTAAEISSWLEA